MTARIGRLLGMAFLACALLSLGGSRAQAQWGWGGWGGYGGFGLFNSPGDPSAFLDSRALQMGAQAATNRPVNDPNFQYNAYYMHVRDTDFFTKYDARTRTEMYNRVSRNPIPLPPSNNTRTPQPATNVATAPAPQPPVQTVVRLANFFDRYSKLVWPADAPKTPELQPKRDLADAAALDVLTEYNQRGIATVSLTTDARQKLVAYGQPALAYIRENASPAISDAFHVFLLSLYNELGQAAKIRKQ